MHCMAYTLLAIATAFAMPGNEGGEQYTNVWAGVRGVNYVPSYSQNPVQTWADYDKLTIERELGFAQKLKLNTVRVFLHMFPWAADRDAFLTSYDHFIDACASRGIKPLIVLFDDDFYDVNVTSVTQVRTHIRPMPQGYYSGDSPHAPRQRRGLARVSIAP